jgi:uncharacterized membrane protein (DUF106 family)
MWTFHRALGALVDGLLYPFRTLPAIVGLTVVALIVSVGILLVFRTASDQEALAAVKRRIHAGVSSSAISLARATLFVFSRSRIVSR